MTLRTTDGTAFKYTPQTIGWYRCSRITDSNGNYLSLGYTTLGSDYDFLDTITDTVGRVIKFNYDPYYHLISITQMWGGQTHLWASFDYSDLTIQTNFGGLAVIGPANGEVIPVLTRVITDDGTRHVFVYNSWGQVNAIWRYGAEDNQRAARTYNFPAASVAQSDCPRFTARGDWAYEWLGFTPSDPNSWATTTFAFDPLGDGGWGSATTPDGTIHKELFATTGWQRGLTTGTETWVGSVKKRWTSVAWAHSGTSTLQKNPRAVETNVYDDANDDGVYDNRRRSTVVYLSYSAGHWRK